MKNCFAAASFAVTFSMAVMAQTEPSPKTEVVWGYDQACSSSNNAMVKAALPKCERVQTDQGTFFIVLYKGLSVAVSYATPHGYIRAMTQVTNRSGKLQDFNPLLSTIDVFNSQSAYLKGRKSRGASNGITADIAKELYIKEEAKYKVIDPFPVGSTNGNVQQTPAPTVTYIEKNGRITNVTTGVPNSPRRPEETRIVLAEPTMPTTGSSARNPTIPNRASQSSLARFNYGIQAGPIMDQQKVAGYVFFENVEESARYLVFRIKVGDLVFVFPEETLKDKNKLTK